MTTAFTEIPAALRGHDIAVVDVEGNGQNPPEIIEIAIIPVAGTVVSPEETRSWMVKPKNPITPIVTRKVHGITNDDVANCPEWEHVSPAIGRVMFGRTLVAHNANVEQKVLTAHLPDWKPLMVLDTLRLAKTVWPGLKSYALDKLIEHAQLDMHGLDDDQEYHRAGYDAWAAWQLLCLLVREGELDWDAVVQSAGLPEFLTPPEPEGLF
ncbi:3'-5' exonuclease [Nocardia concava]|uniref:3'-5' exonuclease n=1 Tax=Nocardia concava TaxID=257281 RepID=UPI0003081BAD|nr:3'-5' exonuclease [Nocardia concava]